MNPELRRNLWLELTPLRLMAAPFSLLLLFLAMTLDSAGQWRFHLFQTAHYVILIAVAFWGARKAADAVAVELRERTWDQQRLSGLGPGAIAIGKVLGAPSFIWFVIGLCLLAQVAALAAGGTTESLAGSELFYGYEPDWSALAAEVAGAFAVFACAFFAAVTAQSGQDRPRAFDATLFQLASVVFGLTLVSIVAAEAGLPFFARDPSPARWWSFAAPPGVMLSAMFAVFGVWALYGGYHQMRRAFAMPTSALPWILFLVFIAVFFAGWPERGKLAAAAVALVASCYAAALVEPHKIVSYRLWLGDLALGRFGALLRAPAWLYAWIGAVGLLIALAAQPDALAELRTDGDFADALPAQSGAWRPLIAVALFVLRDMAICVWAGLRAEDGRGLWTAALALAILWGLGPALNGLATSSSDLSLFLPVGAVSAFSAAIQAGVALALAAGMLVRPARRAEA